MNICSIAASNHCKQEQIIIQNLKNTLLSHIKATVFQYNTCHMDPNVQYHNLNIEFYVLLLNAHKHLWNDLTFPHSRNMCTYISQISIILQKSQTQ